MNDQYTDESPSKKINRINNSQYQQEVNITNQQITVPNEIEMQEQNPLQQKNQDEDISMNTIQEEDDEKIYPYYNIQVKINGGLKNYFFGTQHHIHYFQNRMYLIKGKKFKINIYHDYHLQKIFKIQLNIVNKKQKINPVQQLQDQQRQYFLENLNGLLYIETVGRSGISIVMSKIIEYVANDQLDYAYGFAGLFVGLNLFCIFCKHHAHNYVMIFTSKARMTLINLVLIKITELNSYSIKQANVGKILNLISADLNYLEFMFILLFQSSVIFISIIFGCYILWDRYSSAIGLVAFAIIFVAYPIQVAFQTLNQNTIKEAKSFQDQRIKLTNELVEGIRLIKMYAWEEAFKKILFSLRDKEVQCYLKQQLRSALDRLFSYTSQIWSSFIFFIILYYGNFRNEMDVAEMVSTIQLLTYFKFSCVFMVSYGLQAIVMIKVSFERLSNILNIKNIEIQKINTNEQQQNTTNQNFNNITLSNFSVYWDEIKNDTKPILKNINLEINQGELWGIIGKVGSGKSTLLNTFLFQIPFYQGSFKINGKEADIGELKIAYVEQEPFIFPDTIRKNILFGRTYNKKLYSRVLQVSQLEMDLNNMKFQDHTEIGERGITLSGGQKARLSLARALYSQADLYLLDDPLSAVDSNVAKNIFYLALKQFIFHEQETSNKQYKPIVLLVTHQIQYAVECDKIAVLNDGELIISGTYQDIQDNLQTVNSELAQQLNQSKSTNLTQKQSFIPPEFIKRPKIIKPSNNNLITKEADQQQLVTWKTYVRYFKYWNIIVLIFVMALESGSEIILNFYQRIVSLFQQYQNDNEINQAYFILGMLTMSLIICNFIKYLVSISSCLELTKQLHSDMLTQMNKAPSSYFDTNPSGRIISRYSNDLSLTDNQTTLVILDILETMGNFFFSLITLAILQQYFLILILFIIIVNIYQFSYQKKVISQLREIELMQRSPLFDFLKKTLGGMVQIRVYEQQNWFRKQFLDIANKCNLNSLVYYYSTRCFGFNIDLIGFIVQTIGIFLFLKLNHDNLAILSQGILLLTTFNDGLQWGLRQLITFETQMNSYNRIFQIIDNESEAPFHKPEDSINYNQFPQNGEIIFDNVFMRYRENTDLILKGITFKINSGEKIGCVGRTGAGKSSILQVIFRMCEIENSIQQSKIEISNVDIKQLGLYKLRSSIGIIPQSPFLFQGTIKKNLDPLEQFSENQLWQALEDTNLIDHVKQLKNGLSTDMSDVNSVFSVGQKQLICLARILLQKKKIIVLDEATANVDMKTDDFIQATLKNKFYDCTLITIAHRLNTVADYDKIMVIDDGKVQEFDSPYNLLAISKQSETIDTNTQFAQLVKNTGSQNAQIIFEIAKNKCLNK